MQLSFNSTTVADVQAVESLISHHLNSNIPLIEEVSLHLTSAGGKRFRPLLTLLFARACTELSSHQLKTTCDLAVIVEFIHSATLLHDDVVDEAVLRRGQDTARILYGNQIAVLVGDFLYSRAFQIMVNTPLRAIRLLADATNALAEGEVLQLVNIGNVDEASYLKVIEGKTARLFAVAAQLGAVSADASDTLQKAAYDYGYAVGMAFQIVDDILDYNGNSAEMGKNITSDLKEGKVTLPLIYAFKNSAPQEQNQLKAIMAQAADNLAGQEQLEVMRSIVIESGGVDYAQQAVKEWFKHAYSAIEILPDSVFKNDLSAACQQIENRRF